MLYYLSQSYKIKIQNTKYVQIQNTKYVHARLPTILIQERHSKVNGIPAKRPFLYVYMWHGVSKNIWYPTKPRDTFLWHGVSKKIPRNLATRFFCGIRRRLWLHTSFFFFKTLLVFSIIRKSLAVHTSYIYKLDTSYIYKLHTSYIQVHTSYIYKLHTSYIYKLYIHI